METGRGTSRRLFPAFYGWRIVWALAVTQTVGYGTLYYAFGVLVQPMEAELGFTRAQTGGAFSLGLLVAGLAALPVGRLVDRIGGRWVMTAGSLLGALLLLAWSRVTGLVELYLVWALIGVAMSAALYEVAFTVLATWFRAGRRRAMFVVTLVAGLASTLFTPLTTLLTAHLGWRAALVSLAALLAVLTLPPHALVLRRRPSDLGLGPDGDARPIGLPGTGPPLDSRAAVRSGGFWWLALAFALARFSIAAMGAHLVALLTERGLPAGTVAALVGGIGPLQLVGRVLFLPLSARMSTLTLTGALFLGLALAFLDLRFVPGLTGALVFVTLYGTVNGATTLTRATLTAERFGVTAYGAVNGAVALIVALSAAPAPLLVGIWYSAVGDYRSALLGLSLCAGLAALCLRGVEKASAEASAAL